MTVCRSTVRRSTARRSTVRRILLLAALGLGLAVVTGSQPRRGSVALPAQPDSALEVQAVTPEGDTAPRRSSERVDAAPRLLTSGPQAIELEVRFGAPELIETELDGRRYRYLECSERIAVGGPGEPMLPTQTLRVALPPTGEPELILHPVPRTRMGNLRFPPAPTPQSLNPQSAGRRPDPQGAMIRVEGEAYAARAALPFAELVDVGIERGVRVAQIEVRPVAWNPATGEAEWLESLRIEVRLNGAGSVSPQTAPELPGRLDGALWNDTVVNPASARTWQAAPARTCAPLPEYWFDDAAGWLKISIPANGIYRLDRRALEIAGVPVGTVDPRTFRMYCGPLRPEVPWGTVGWDSIPFADFKVPVEGYRHMDEVPGLGFVDSGIGTPGGLEQVAIWVPGEENGAFDAGESVLFYALGPDNYRDRFEPGPASNEPHLESSYTNHTVYWLAWGGDLGEAPLRMSTRDAAPGAGPRATQTTQRLHLEENELYDPAMYEPGYAWEGWFWEFLTSGTSGQRFLLDLPHLVPETQMTARVRLWGGQRPLFNGSGQEDLHHVRLTVNGAVVPAEDGEIHIWGGGLSRSFTPYDIISGPVPAASPASFVFSVLKVGNDPQRFDMVYLADMDLTYRRLLHADGAPAEFELDPAEGARTVSIAGAPTGPLEAYDVSDFRRPVRLLGATRVGGAAEIAVTASTRVLALTSQTAGKSPSQVERLEPPRNNSGAVSWLRSIDEPLDYLIITHRDFTAAAEQLAAWRRNHLWQISDTRPARVRVVTVDQIMAEYAFGMYDPAAIRYFLETVFRCYGDGEDRLAYALFLGDHTYDFRDFEESGVKDWVPSWENNRDSISQIVWGNTQYVTDDALARFDGRNDIFTDLFIGRIPVESAAEARALVEGKIIASEANPDRGPWRTKAILCADDICQGRRVDVLGFTHLVQTERMGNAIPDAYDLDKVYLYEFGEDCNFDTKPEAKRAFLQSWSEGAWLVNYIGHGGDVVMADEQVMSVADVPLLTNHLRLPVMGSFSCSVGKFSKPLAQGLGEALLRAPTTGTIVSAAATHLTFSGRNERSNLSFIEHMFDEAGRPVPIGVALMRAKRDNTSESQKYVCLGDPASPLSVPAETFELTGPGFLRRGATVTYGLDTGAGTQGGTLDAAVRDATVEVTRNSKGETFREHIDRIAREWGTRPGGAISSYTQTGPALFRGQAPVTAGTGNLTFTVPASLRGGASGKVRAYAWGDDWDGLGVQTPVEVGGTLEPSDDATGPVIAFSAPSGPARSGQTVELTLEDASGINLTQLFDFRAILLKILDDRGIEQLRMDLTPRFAYDLGSHTRGTASFVIPDLPPARYTFVASAFDNLNNRGDAAVELDLSGAGAGAALAEVAAYPNPFNPDQEPTQVLFTLSAAARVTIQVYSVAGREVHSAGMDGAPGRNALAWNGRDRAGDLVANGVYLVQVTAHPEAGGSPAKHLERVVVFR